MTSDSCEFKNRAGQLDTLAQKRTGSARYSTKTPLLIGGNGSDLSNAAALQRRAKRKATTQFMMLNLVDIATKKKKPEMAKAYWNTFHCQSRVITDSGRLYGKYCKNRFCTLCCSIRKATIINKYLPVIKRWQDCHFVTLTVKAIPANQLRSCLKDMLKRFALIIDKHRKRYNRGKGRSLVGIKSLECNFNPKMRTYNPHFHVLVLNKEMAETLINEWLLQFNNPKQANSKGQFIREVRNKERDLIEIVKYGSKIFTEIHLKSKDKNAVTPFVFMSALDNIFTSMSGLRIFDRFGCNLPPNSDNKASLKASLGLKLFIEYEEWNFESKISDWVCSETGEILSGYSLSKELIQVFKNNLDLKTQ